LNHQISKPRYRQQCGAATLIVVMLLFFVMSLTAAYTARNLIFEQRTSANLYRTTQSFEAAEAGLEWAIARLNSGRVDSLCTSTNVATFDTFRQRYLTVNATNGDIRRVLRAPFAAADLQSFRWAACVFNGNDWVCACPTDDLPVPSNVMTAGGPYPAFAVRFDNQFARPGLTRVEVNGCTSADSGCLFNIRFETGGFSVCRSTLCSLVALQSAVTSPPLAAVTARGNITANVATVSVTNEDLGSGGWTLRAGALVNRSPGPILRSTPGTPPSASLLENDSALTGLAVESDDCVLCMATATFNLSPATHRQQPAALVLDCTVACTGASVTAARLGHPQKPVVLLGAGGLSLASATDDVGSLTDPVLLRVDGPVTFSGGATVIGLVYARGLQMTAGTVQGAVVSAADLTLSGTATVVYDANVLGTLQRARGSFVRVPGGWRDIP